VVVVDEAEVRVVHVAGGWSGEVGGVQEREGQLAAGGIEPARLHAGLISSHAVVRQQEPVAIQVVYSEHGRHLVHRFPLQDGVATGDHFVGEVGLAHLRVGFPFTGQCFELRECRHGVACLRRRRTHDHARYQEKVFRHCCLHGDNERGGWESTGWRKKRAIETYNIQMRRLTFSLLLSFGLARAAEVTVGTASAQPGQKANGYIRVPAGTDAASDVPVTVINGTRRGPVLALVAGAHGTEYASIVALHKLAEALEPGSLSGVVIAVPLLNVASFTQVVPHLNPVDGKNMNRLYPGKPDGTQTERALWAVTKHILEKCDYLIDFHGGDLDENLRPYAYWADTGQQRADAISRGMVLAFGLDHIIIQNARTPAVAGAVTISRQAQAMGKAAIVVEAGHAGTTDAGDVEVLVRGTMNVMRHLQMLPGTATAVERPVWIGSISAVAGDREGVFYSLAAPEAYVRKGMRIGYVTDYFGMRVADVTTPVSGVIIYIRAIPSLKKGDTIAYVGEIAEEPPQ
jgi:uncharacterized protein